ncbi:hypothetical protein sscle_07g062080 [Sclerotinia sclerotiorum 1980 UF-70]|uniref:Uncharacterized protein n=1 Tax=Sclerotinia sclerotiorum (strain ATCC 18683 / 1980 / Ss-1) TaxID=665079 RepID=A0A1D9Q921_SCLS1|nr:hypothetical protein sscle_07g062080 [Sclerotinia sclerotiorum 1980 UF-70]
MINRIVGGISIQLSEVKFLDLLKTNYAKAFAKDVSLISERKLGDRRRSDTVVVLTINYADRDRAMLSFDSLGTSREIKVFGFWGSMVARLKLKEIDGKAHQAWSLRLNLTQHGETHQVQHNKD